MYNIFSMPEINKCYYQPTGHVAIFNSTHTHGPTWEPTYMVDLKEGKRGSSGALLSYWVGCVGLGILRPYLTNPSRLSQLRDRLLCPRHWLR